MSGLLSRRNQRLRVNGRHRVTQVPWFLASTQEALGRRGALVMKIEVDFNLSELRHILVMKFND